MSAGSTIVFKVEDLDLGNYEFETTETHVSDTRRRRIMEHQKKEKKKEKQGTQEKQAMNERRRLSDGSFDIVFGVISAQKGIDIALPTLTSTGFFGHFYTFFVVCILLY